MEAKHADNRAREQNLDPDRAEELTDEHHSGAHHHITPPSVYVAVFVALMVLLVLTVWAAFRHLGALTTPVALLIASVKAALIILYFMHVKYSTRLTWIFAGASFIWFAILIGMTVVDYATRHELPRAQEMTKIRRPSETPAKATLHHD